MMNHGNVMGLAPAPSSLVSGGLVEEGPGHYSFLSIIILKKIGVF